MRYRGFLPLNVVAAAGLAALCLLLAPDAVQAQAEYKVGDRVAVPAGYGDKWLDAVVIGVDPSNKTFPFRVHPLGYTPYMDSSYMAKQLRPRGNVKTEPIGGIVNDPWLLKVQGKTVFKPTAVAPGAYNCFAYSNNRLEPRPILDFTILADGRYRDNGGNNGSYRFDPGSGQLVFSGGGLDGQRATYEQASNPPVKSQPPAVHLAPSGDVCDLRM